MFKKINFSVKNCIISDDVVQVFIDIRTDESFSKQPQLNFNFTNCQVVTFLNLRLQRISRFENFRFDLGASFTAQNYSNAIEIIIVFRPSLPSVVRGKMVLVNTNTDSNSQLIFKSSRKSLEQHRQSIWKRKAVQNTLPQQNR